MRCTKFLCVLLNILVFNAIFEVAIAHDAEVIITTGECIQIERNGKVFEACEDIYTLLHKDDEHESISNFELATLITAITLILSDNDSK